MKTWRVFITPAAERVAKKLPPKVQNFIFYGFPDQVRMDPLIGQQLSGPLDWLRSFHFSMDGQPYRIAYGIEPKIRKVTIHYADYRNHFYERLRRLLRL